ncbi:MAG TPA: PucR family transcriptional regulator ligand-binding domain-containing protein [Acidimicrobiia bacterium]|nr:PucR family transcriptional regulator ligand-binding domain-containing protein [Acidimicrobiia bacterium]
MAATVSMEEVLKIPELDGARVVAGHAGLGRVLDEVTIVAARETFDYLRGDQLILAAGETLVEAPEDLVPLLPELVHAGVAGLAIKPPRWVEALPKEILELADALDFPLIEVPETMPLNDIAAGVLHVVLDHQAARLRRVAEIHERFTAVVLSGGRTRDVVLTLQRLLKVPVAAVDPTGVTVAAEPPGTWPEGDADGPRFEHPIRAGDEPFGMIVVQADPETLDDEAVVAVQQAAVAIALRQVQARAVAEAQEGFAAVSLEEFISGQIRDNDELAERAGTFGWDLDVPRAVLLAAPATVGSGPSEPELRRLAAAARHALGESAIVWVRSRNVAALIAPASSSLSERRHAATILQREAAVRLGPTPLSVGVGRVVTDPLFLPASFREARIALETALWEQGPGAARAFDELGMERLLAACPPEEVEDFKEQLLGRLLAYDETQGGELVTTLVSWLETRSIAETARRVYAHYNTVRKRLERIEELLGVPLSDPRRALDLAVALRVHERSDELDAERAATPPVSPE